MWTNKHDRTMFRELDGSMWSGHWQTVCSQNSGQEEFVFLLKEKKHNMPLKWKGLRCFENDMRKESVGGFWSKHPFITNILYWVNILNKISMELIKSIYNITYTGLLLCVNNMPRLQYLCSYPWLRFAVIGNSLGKEYIYKITCIPILLLHVHVVRNYITIWKCFI